MAIGCCKFTKQGPLLEVLTDLFDRFLQELTHEAFLPILQQPTQAGMLESARREHPQECEDTAFSASTTTPTSSSVL